MIFDNFFTKAREYQQEQINALLKASGDNLEEKPIDEEDRKETKVGRQAILDDPFYRQHGNFGIFKSRPSRLSNKMLKDSSLRDWLVSSIMQIRVDTLVRFSRPQKKKFDMGFRVIKRGDNNLEYNDEDRKNIANIESFVYNCGRLDGTPNDDKLLFGEYLKLIVRDALTFGYTATEKIKTRKGALHRFRPVPAEQTYLINKELSKDVIEKEIKAIKPHLKPRSDNDPQTKQELERHQVDFYKYVQVSYENHALAVFGDEDMIFKLFNPQNFGDSMGYCYGPLELSIINVTNHLNAENYNSNFFTHGYAAKGILHLKGTVTQQQLTSFRRQFYNSISGTSNAWRTPIIAGLDEVDWVPMSGSARDMEYINFNNHLMRSICTQFQIDPVELGLDYLSSQTGRAQAAGQQGNQQKIEYSRERGLYPILMYIEDLINKDIIPAIDPELSKKYMFIFDGYSDVTPQTEVALQQAEMTVHSSMNDLLTDARKNRIDDFTADVPLNQSFWAVVEKNLTRGEIRERFFGDKDASKRRELQYIPGDPAFLQWQQVIMTIDTQKKSMQMQEEQMQQQQQAQEEQMQAEKEQQEKDHALEAAKHNREEEAHKAELDARANADAKAAVDHGRRKQLQETAKTMGATSATNLGGRVIKNPINNIVD